MPLAVTQLTGFAAGGARGPIEVFLTASENNVNLFAKASAVGDPTQPNSEVNVYLSSGVVLGSTSTATSAVVSGTGYGAGTVLKVILLSGVARIQGAGGAGGEGAFFLDALFNVFKMPGGGGGAGTVPGAGAVANGNPGTPDSGGAAQTVSAPGPATGAQNGFPGGNALEASSGGPNLILEVAAGAVLQVFGGAGGGGGSPVGTSNPAPSGAGGNPGLPGQGSTFQSSSTSGGANGLAYYEPGAASVTESGAGTIDARGT